MTDFFRRIEILSYDKLLSWDTESLKEKKKNQLRKEKKAFKEKHGLYCIYCRVLGFFLIYWI